MELILICHLGIDDPAAAPAPPRALGRMTGVKNARSLDVIRESALFCMDPVDRTDTRPSELGR